MPYRLSRQDQSWFGKTYKHTDKMKTTYRLQILNRRGMYTYGDTASSAKLAKLAPGSLILKDGDRLGIEECQWEGSINGNVIRQLILIDAEYTCGQWEIGVSGGDKYRAAK